MASATYRLQLRPGFGLVRARELIPYLHKLGITHLYLSPILQARAGSTHGYDVVDPTRLNPELGSEADLSDLAQALRDRDMGLVLDIVPNHMAASDQNPYWEDALTHGPASRFARWFDIDWGMGSGASTRRVLLPVLGARLGQILARRELRPIYREGTLRLDYFDRSFPIDPASLPLILRPYLRRAPDSLPPPETARLGAALEDLEDAPPRTRAYVDERADRVGEAARRFRRLFEESTVIRQAVIEACDWITAPEARADFRRLLGSQAYRLAYWRRAAREINYRRFFTISHLVGLRQEEPEVFRATHATLLRWVSKGAIAGFRIDHIDGLRDPHDYLGRLSEAVQDAGAGGSRFPIFVEKILAPHERLPADWPVAGTTGYEVLNAIEDLFIDPGGYSNLTDFYRQLTGRRSGFHELAISSKRLILREHMAAEVRRVARHLERATGGTRYSGERRALEAAVREVAANLAVYRTYVRRPPCQPGSPDRLYLEQALDRARHRGAASESALSTLEAALLEDLAPDDETARASWHEFGARFQQLTGPAMAKGVEDTAHYIYVPLVSRNEVGGEPDLDLTDATARMHRLNAERLHEYPQAMVSVSTHDTKRSADVRSRLDVLSESPDDWKRTVLRWAELNHRHRTEVDGHQLPDRNTEYLLYQTLVGVWTAPGSEQPRSPDGEGLEAIRERVHDYMLKAVREAKRHTSWVEPNEAYESALHDFIQRVLTLSDEHRFPSELNDYVAGLARPGFWNATARTLIQLTVPGTPDTFQGDELWNFSLVDPDNRRPVDFEIRRRLLDEDLDLDKCSETERLRALSEMARSPEDGRLKMRVLRSALDLRRTYPELFQRGEYVPLQIRGARADHAIAFARGLPERAAVIVAPTRVASLVSSPREPPTGEVWNDTRVDLPAALAEKSWTSALSGAILSKSGQSLPLRELLSVLPAALLVSEG